MSADDMNEDSGSEDEVLKRLLELKELYKVQRDEVGGQEGNSSEDSIGEVKPHNSRKPRAKHRRVQAELRLSALQSVILQTVEEHGGLCHAETIIEYVRLKWPELRKRDSELYNTNDCRKVVDDSLRGINLFNQQEQDGYWGINSDWEGDDDDTDDTRNSRSDDDEVEGLLLLDLDSDFGKPVPMTHLITQAIEDRAGGCNIEDIYNFVLRNWERPYIRRSVVRRGLTDEDIKESIQVVLRTDPKYLRDPYNPDMYTVTHDYKPILIKKSKASYKGKSSPNSVVPRALSPIPSSMSRVPSHENRPRSNSIKRPRSQSTPTTILHTLTPSSPTIPPNPPNPSTYQCLCGAREPGGRGKWHTSQGQWLCHTCGPAWSKKNSCPMCGKVYRNAEAKYAIENSWIRCDDCHRWVMTKCDGIEDLSIYDDENPDHIHYSCPLCRSIRLRLEEEKNRPESEKEEKEGEHHHFTQESPNNKSPTPALPILIVKPVTAITPIQAIHVIHPINHLPHSSSPTPFSTSSPRAHYLAENSPTQHLIAPIARFHIGSFGRSPTSDREEEIDALMKIGSSTSPVTKIATPVKIGPTTKIGPITKIDTKPKSKPPAKRSRAQHEDALVPSQELTAEILSNMPLFSPSPRPQTPPALSSPRNIASPRPVAAISRPIQVQSQPILPQFQPSPGQFQPSPVQFGSKLGPVQPQFGLIQPTGLFAHLTQTAQLLPAQPTQPLTAIPIPAQTTATATQYQFHQTHFKQTPPAVATPIKYDYVRDASTQNDVTRAQPSTASPRAGDVNNFERDTTDTQMGEAASPRSYSIDEMETGSTLDEDLRIFKESLEQERKAIWANYNV